MRYAFPTARVGQEEFSPAALELQGAAPSPLPTVVLRVICTLLGLTLVWAAFGRVDIIAVAPGKLVPATSVKVVQPADSGIVQEILVREGDRVSAGQVLVRMDASLSQSDADQVQHELQVRGLQMRRIEAEFTGVAPRRDSTDPPELYQQVVAQYNARRRAYLAALATERAMLAHAEEELRAAGEHKSKLEQTVPIYRDQERSWQQLVDQGFAGRLLAEERRRQRIEAEQELKAQLHAIEAARATIAQSRQRSAQIESEYRQQLADEQVEAAAQLARLQQEWKKQSRRQELLELKAPQAGIIKELATHTVGAVLGAGTVLMTLVPTDEALHAEVWVNNEDIGFVREGQPAKLKVAPFPFQKYGMVEGVVQHISADSSERPPVGEPDRGSGPPNAVGFRALVALSTPSLDANGTIYALTPGMQVQGEIHLGTRTVLEYLLSPVRKAVHEAGRER